MNPGFWRGRRVFLTGHTGFKGSWLALWLRRLGAEVTGFALPPPTTPSLFELARVGADIRSLVGDVRDLPALREALRAAQPEVVLHLAAQSLVRPSYQDPVETYSTNVMGTVHLLEAARGAPSVRATVVVTSDKCYENREWHWGYRENEPMGGHDPYSNSKGCAELVTAAYRASFFPAEGNRGVATARAGNVIGGGDWARDRLVPDLLQAFLDGRSPLIRNPSAIRPWQHVLEPLAGYLRLAECLHAEPTRHATAWNFGPPEDHARDVAWLADGLVARWPGSAAWTRDAAPQPHEARFLKLDSSRARAELGWQPKLSLPATLDWIVEWYADFRRGADLQATTLGQIDRYQSRAEVQPCGRQT